MIDVIYIYIYIYTYIITYTDIDFCGLANAFSDTLCCNNLLFYIILKYTLYFY